MKLRGENLPSQMIRDLSFTDRLIPNPTSRSEFNRDSSEPLPFGDLDLTVSRREDQNVTFLQAKPVDDRFGYRDPQGVTNLR